MINGIIKYNNNTGRFTSTEPLYEKYFGWSPYQYTRNNPINRLDGNGFADFITNDGILNDGNNDGEVYLSFKSDMENSMVYSESGNGTPSLDYSLLKSNSTLLPDKKLRNKISSDNVSKPIGESGGVGGQGFYKHGGRNFDRYYGDFMGSAKHEVEKAIYDCNSTEKDLLQYYVHSHFWKDIGDGSPSNPGDFDAFPIFNSQFGVGLYYGILFFKSDVYFFNSNKEQIKISTETFNNLGN